MSVRQRQLRVFGTLTASAGLILILSTQREQDYPPVATAH